MSTTLQKITTRAKQIRKGNKKLSWIEAVKKAGAEYRKGNKKPTQYKSKTTGKWKKLTADDKTNINQLKKYHYQLRGVKKKAVKKNAPVSKHKDTKSHNVNIRVMSGVSKIASLAAMQKRQAIADIQKEQRDIAKELGNIAVIEKLILISRKEKNKTGVIAMRKSKKECKERIAISKRKINSLKKYI